MSDLEKQAKKKEYNPIIDLVIHNIYIENTFKSRKPSINLEKQSKIIAKVTSNHYRCKKSTTKVIEEVKVLQSIVAYVLKTLGYNR